jgi:predicted amidophosphoribosyltransferase
MEDRSVEGEAKKGARRVELTVHCPKCRTPIGPDTKLCTSCGAEVDKVPSVDRPISPFRKHMGIHKGIGDVDAHIEEMRGR